LPPYLLTAMYGDGRGLKKAISDVESQDLEERLQYGLALVLEMDHQKNGLFQGSSVGEEIRCSSVFRDCMFYYGFEHFFSIHSYSSLLTNFGVMKDLSLNERCKPYQE